jgi:hypothetical protein
MDRLFGRFLALSKMTTSVPISGPSSDMSEKMPAVCMPACLAFVAIVGVFEAASCYEECINAAIMTVSGV